jgi:hypothetical protein
MRVPRPPQWLMLAIVLLALLAFAYKAAHSRGMMLGVGPTGGISGTYLTFSGPASGNISVPSTNFTVTINAGTFNGSQTVTIADGLGGSGGTFAPSVGTCASPGTCTVTPTAASSSFTYTYTPAAGSAGTTVTLTFTNSLSRPEIPTSLTYVVNPVGGAGALVLFIP